MKTLAVIIGRFQPLHNGHLKMIQQAEKENDEVLVIVGSRNKLPDYRNPIPFEDRVDMVKAMVSENTKVIGSDDKDNLSDWIMDINGEINHFSDDESDGSNILIYTSTKDQEFYKSHFIFDVKAEDHGYISATNIRADWYHDGLFQVEEVPEVTVDYLDNFCEDEFIRLQTEYHMCMDTREIDMQNHEYGNPIHPVAHAMLYHGTKVLLIKRGGIRGHGQWAFPGGFIEHTESALDAATRELKEETGITLTESNARLLTHAYNDHLNGLSTRTMSINSLIAVSEEFTCTVDPEEVLDWKWVDVMDVLEGRLQLFYNHNMLLRQLFTDYAERNS